MEDGVEDEDDDEDDEEYGEENELDEEVDAFGVFGELDDRVEVESLVSIPLSHESNDFWEKLLFPLINCLAFNRK